MGWTNGYLPINMKKIQPPITIPAKNITHIHYSGLSGRIMHIPSTVKKNKKRFVLIAGQHTSHERTLAFAEFLADYGDVYAIDMPGFGGMASFKRIGKDINFDNYAEYLYTVLKTQKLTKNVTIFAISIGGQFVTRMLQRYPESEKWLDRVVGFVTFGAPKDFKMKLEYKIPASLFVEPARFLPGRIILKTLVFNRFSIRAALWVTSKFKKKMQADEAELKQMMVQMERYHWGVNDLQTWGQTAHMMFTDDLRKHSDQPIRVPMHNILTRDDQYFDPKEVNKTMRDLYADYTPHYLALDVHMPSFISNKEQITSLFEPEAIGGIIGTKES